MFWEKIKKKIQNAVEDAVSIDNLISNYGNDNYDINAEIAKRNYEEYQNDLKQRSKDIIKKWNKKIMEASGKAKNSL